MIEKFKVVLGNELGISEIIPFENYSQAKACFIEKQNDDAYVVLKEINTDHTETILEQKQNEQEIKHTSKDWYNTIYPNKEVKILDPDGWDRSNFTYSWGVEEITQNEFMQRVLRSTVSGYILKK